MEKTIKRLSTLMAVITVSFFLFSFLGANAEALGLGQTIYQILVVCVNVLLFAIPLLFLIIFGMGMSIMLQTIMAKQNRFRAVKTTKKLPILHFVISIICFTLFFIFMSAIYSV